MSAGVPALSARHVLEAARPVDEAALCAAAGIDAAALAGDASVPIARLVRLYELASRWTRDPDFGLRVGARVDLGTFDLVGQVAIHSATVGESLERIGRYLPLWTTSARLSWESERSSARLAWSYVDGGIGDARHDTEMTLLTVSRVGSFARSHELARPREVRFRHRQPRGSEHARWFGAPVRFGMPANELVYDRAALSTPLVSSDPGLCTLLVDYGERLLAELPRGITTAVERARAVLEQAIVDLDTLARRLGTSTRSLQRTLRAHGTSYRGLVEDVRRRLALAFLGDGSQTVAEIAERLGYGHPSELHRAFRAWTGVTPGRFRAKGC